MLPCRIERQRTDLVEFERYVGRQNLQFKKAKVEELKQEGVESIDEREWSACFKHVMDVEQEFWRRDTAVEEEVVCFII